MNLITLNTKPQAPDGLADDLRKLADMVDRGEVLEVVAAYVDDVDYKFIYGASHERSLALATLLQFGCLRRFET